MKRAIALETERTRRDGTRPGYAAPRPAGAPLTAPAPPPKKDQLRGRCPSEDSPGSWAPNPDSSHSNWTIPRGQVSIYQVGSLNDPPGWDHIGNDAENAHPVQGVVEIDVDEIKNTGKFSAKLELPQGRFRIVMDRFHEFSPCQDGGIAAFIYEHGDSGCGDTNWPKSLLYVAGWGYGHASLNGKKIYEDYQIHFARIFNLMFDIPTFQRP